MSIVHEVTLAAHCSLRTLGIALITNKCLSAYDSTPEAVHEGRDSHQRTESQRAAAAHSRFCRCDQTEADLNAVEPPMQQQQQNKQTFARAHLHAIIYSPSSFSSIHVDANDRCLFFSLVHRCSRSETIIFLSVVSPVCSCTFLNGSES